VIADAAEATAPGIFQGPNGWCNASFTRNLYYNHSGTNTTIGTINTNTANTTITGTRKGALITHSFAGVHTRTFPGYPHTHLNFQTVNASFADWRALHGQDKGSLLDVDPLFESASPLAEQDLRVSAASPAVTELGFVPFDLRGARVGPRRRAGAGGL
jgi:hypothetical protein